MTPQTEDAAIEAPDPAAIFASALSLWNASREQENSDDGLDLSESYNGMDQFMREVMRVATTFETWACSRIDFAVLDEVWPYLLQNKFGEACIAVISPTELHHFDDSDCLRVAMHLRLPIKFDDKLPLPVNVTVPNPIHGSGFREFRIQSMRDAVSDNYAAPYTLDDDPFDADFGAPYYALYGIGADGLLEFIAQRKSYSDAADLARRLAPGVNLPTSRLCPPC
jgi:hypothetical protein